MTLQEQILSELSDLRERIHAVEKSVIKIESDVALFKKILYILLGVGFYSLFSSTKDLIAFIVQALK
jgi:hypothetical protein